MFHSFTVVFSPVAKQVSLTGGYSVPQNPIQLALACLYIDSVSVETHLRLDHCTAENTTEDQCELQTEDTNNYTMPMHTVYLFRGNKQ